MFLEHKLVPRTKKEEAFWNIMQFLKCEVMDVSMAKYDCGCRLAIEIRAPRLYKKYFLYVWDDAPYFQTIKDAGLRKGDIISVYTNLSYYKKVIDGKEMYQEAYQIIPNYDFGGGAETETCFRLMHLTRTNSNHSTEGKPCLSADELLKKML